MESAISGNMSSVGCNYMNCLIYWVQNWIFTSISLPEILVQFGSIGWLQIGTIKIWLVFMMMARHGNTFHITGSLWRNPPVTSGSLYYGLVVWNFTVFFVVSLKHLFWRNSRVWVIWDGMRLMWCHCTVLPIYFLCTYVSNDFTIQIDALEDHMIRVT